MADIVVLNDLGGNSLAYHRRFGPFWKSYLTGYVIYEDGANPGLLRYRKTTDGGQTWAAAVTIISMSPGQVQCLGLWYDRWTPGDTGTKVHIVVGKNSMTIAVRYLTFDIATETVSSSVVVVANMEPLGVGTANIVKARNGNLYIGGWNGDLFIGFYRSVNSGATWVSRSTTAFTTSWTSKNQFDMHSGLEADQADIWLVCRQNVTNNMVLWVYDDSANSWSSTVIVASTASLDKQLATCTRLSDGHVIVICATTTWNISQAFKCYDIASSASITEKTSPMTAQYVVSLAVMASQVDGVLWLAYGRGATGATDVTVYYRTSTDGGATWSAETTYSVSAYDNRAVWLQPSVPTTTTGRFYPLLDDVIGGTNLYGNYDNSVIIGGNKVRVAGLRHVYRSGSYREEITIGDVTGAVELAQRQFIEPDLAPVEPEPVKRPIAVPTPVPTPTPKLPFSAPGPLMEEPPSRPVAVPTPVDAGMWRPRTFVEYLQTYTGEKPLIQQVPKAIEAGKNIVQKAWGWIRKTVPGLRQ